MATRVQRVTIYAGEDRVLTFSVVDPAGAAVDCTDYVASFRARLRGDTAITLDYSTNTTGVAWTDEAAGEASITLAEAATDTLTEGAAYDWQIEIESDGGLKQITHYGELEVRDSLWV